MRLKLHFSPLNFRVFIFCLFVLPSVVCPAGVKAQSRSSEKIDFSNDKSELYKESHALLIGVSEYRNPAWKKLPGVKEDLPEVETALKKHGFTVETVLNPTLDQLNASLRTFIGKYGSEPENRLLIYFAGHGHTLPSQYDTKLSYLIPSDALSPDNKSFKTSAFYLKDIENYSAQIDAKHVLFMFDACFSGAIFTDRSGNVSAPIAASAKKPVRQVITSGSEGQTVPDQSVFRRQFVKALDGAADSNGDGFVTGGELGLYLYNNVSSDSQQPQSGKVRTAYTQEGDFIFVLPENPGAKTAVKTTVAPKTEYKMPPNLEQAMRLYSGVGGTYDEARAKTLLMEVTATNDPLATMWLSRMYFWGRSGFQVDEKYARILAESVYGEVLAIAEQGNPYAASSIGICYYLGTGVEKDTSKAVIWWRKAAAAGNASAMNNLGASYRDGEGVPKDLTLALSLFRKAADLGEVRATDNAGFMLLEGLGTPPDYAQGIAYYEKAANQGYAYSMLKLGNIYANGYYRFAKNPATAISWYTKAADKGDEESAIILADVYRTGYLVDAEVPTDKNKALSIYLKEATDCREMGLNKIYNFYFDDTSEFKKEELPVRMLIKTCADKGNASALGYIGEFYDKGIGGEKNSAQALNYYLKAADKQNAFAMARLAQVYFDGKLAPKNLPKSFDFAQKSYNLNYTPATTLLGLAYEEGRGVTVNLQRAFELYSEAAFPNEKLQDPYHIEGYRDAQFYLARMYENGNGVERDYSMAIKLYRRAANLLLVQASERLVAIYSKGIGVPVDLKEAERWQNRLKNPKTKRFTVPCDIAGKAVRAPFNIYINEYPSDENPLKEEAERLLEDHNATIPPEVVQSFTRLYQIARENKVSFVDLCVYALSQANKPAVKDKK